MVPEGNPKNIQSFDDLASRLQAGDILLFGSSVYNIWHAALYIGGGNFIHAPYSGAVVSIQSLSSTAGMRLVAARRIV